jgi:hypothetical protein
VASGCDLPPPPRAADRLAPSLGLNLLQCSVLPSVPLSLRASFNTPDTLGMEPGMALCNCNLLLAGAGGKGAGRGRKRKSSFCGGVGLDSLGFSVSSGGW